MYSWKYHLAHKNVTYAVFLNTRKTRLNWSLELLPTTTFCKVQVHPTKLETKSGLEKKPHMRIWHFHEYYVCVCKVDLSLSYYLWFCIELIANLPTAKWFFQRNRYIHENHNYWLSIFKSCSSPNKSCWEYFFIHAEIWNEINFKVTYISNFKTSNSNDS